MYKELLAKKDEDLERNAKSCLDACIDTFLDKKGIIHFYKNDQKNRVSLFLKDAVYPICSGGVCRSQTLWGLLKPFADRIVLFPPHAARHGWDPYNGQINRFRNLAAQEVDFDGFAHYFGFEKHERFGFSESPKWELALHEAQNLLKNISDYYSQHYFGPSSAWKGQRGSRRVYIAFANNAHVALHRLCQANQDLDKVILVSIDHEDLISHPLPEWQIVPRSVAAYARFAAMLLEILDLTNLSSIESSLAKL